MDDLGLRQAYKRLRTNKIGYTLVELLTVLTIIMILSTFGIFVYNRAIVYAKGTVCQTNLQALETAIEVYAAENDALPASLGQLKLEHLEKGYARAMGERRWLKKLSFFLDRLVSFFSMRYTIKFKYSTYSSQFQSLFVNRVQIIRYILVEKKTPFDSCPLKLFPFLVITLSLSENEP